MVILLDCIYHIALDLPSLIELELGSVFLNNTFGHCIWIGWMSYFSQMNDEF